jgi:hypothetical protein
MNRNRFRIVLLVVALAVTALSSACGIKSAEPRKGAEPSAVQEPEYIGYIVSKEGKRILVVDNEEQSFGSSGGASHFYNAIWFSNVDSGLEIGQQVKVWSDGKIAESYPGQGKAVRVETIAKERPDGATLTEPEAVRKALASPRISEFFPPAVKTIQFDREAAEWKIDISQSGQEQGVVVTVPDMSEGAGEPITDDHEPEDGKPPMPTVTANNASLKVYRGSYRWVKASKKVFADYGSTAEILKDKPSDRVRPEEKLTFHFAALPPTEIRVIRLLAADTMMEETIVDSSFFASKEPGVYVYTLNASWQDQSSLKVSTASYLLSIEVAEQINSAD